MNKNFNIARKPGQGSAVSDSAGAAETATKPQPKLATKKTRVKPEKPATGGLGFELGHTTRKTIEVPEGYFYQVKMVALQRRMKEKELWAEILHQYFVSK